MSLTFGPSYLDIPIESTSQIVVQKWDGSPATLTTPVTLLPGNLITFEVDTDGRYTIVVTNAEISKQYHTTLTTDTYDPSEVRQYIDAHVQNLQDQINAGGGGGGGGVPPNRTLTAGTGLTGGGDLTANRTFALNAATISSLSKADSAVQPAGLTKSAVGLGNVDNTSDANKPISSATQAALNLKAPLASPSFTGTVSGITKAMVNLGNVDNTSDANKPISSATQTALDGKAASSHTHAATDLISGVIDPARLGTGTANANKVLTGANTWVDIPSGGGGGGDVPSTREIATGTGLEGGGDLSADRTLSLNDVTLASLERADTAVQPAGLTKAAVGLGNVDNTADTAKPVSNATQTALNLKAPLASPAFTGTVTGISKAMVGLANADNTSDASKPVSDATQTALNLKAPLASPAFTGTVTGITKAMVGLANVDNTADSAKPVSTAQQTALNLKANIASPTFTGTVSGITKAMVGLSNVDNTADSVKPVSTAQQTAINARVENLGGVAAARRVTQAQFNALTPDANTLYYIVG